MSFGHEGAWDYVNCKVLRTRQYFPIPDGEALRELYEHLYAAEKGEEMIKLGNLDLIFGFKKGVLKCFSLM